MSAGRPRPAIVAIPAEMFLVGLEVRPSLCPFRGITFSSPVCHHG